MNFGFASQNGDCEVWPLVFRHVLHVRLLVIAASLRAEALEGRVVVVDRAKGR